jgi:hypothetical protein
MSRVSPPANDNLGAKPSHRDHKMYKDLACLSLGTVHRN